MNDIRQLPRDEFPSTLLEINDPPKELYIKGELPNEELTWLAVVGSRKYSRYGREVCEKLISSLAGYPVVIVSGLALGIDGIAHKAALDATLPTIAVPGSGLHPSVLYPRTHRGLAEEIVDRGGALLAEFAPDFQATTWSFPQRNRILAGLSQAVLVVEAEEKSGALITARLALDYNRDVFAVPGDIFSPSSKGTNRLIRQGATPITCPDDLIEALGWKTREKEKPETALRDATPVELIVWKLLEAPRGRDELIAESGLTVHEFNTAISLLEIKGLIDESMGELSRRG